MDLFVIDRFLETLRRIWRKEGSEMTVLEFMTVIGFAGLFFSAGFAVGRIVERLSNTKNDRQ